MGKLTSFDKRKKARRLIKELGIKTRRQFVSIICNKCKKEQHIRTTNPELYTEEYRQKYVCLFCRNPVKR